MDIRGNPCSGGQFVDWLRISFGFEFTDGDDLLVTCSSVRSKRENEEQMGKERIYARIYFDRSKRLLHNVGFCSLVEVSNN